MAHLLELSSPFVVEMFVLALIGSEIHLQLDVLISFILFFFSRSKVFNQINISKFFQLHHKSKKSLSYVPDVFNNSFFEI